MVKVRLYEDSVSDVFAYFQLYLSYLQLLKVAIAMTLGSFIRGRNELWVSANPRGGSFF